MDDLIPKSYGPMALFHTNDIKTTKGQFWQNFYVDVLNFLFSFKQIIPHTVD